MADGIKGFAQVKHDGSNYFVLIQSLPPIINSAYEHILCGVLGSETRLGITKNGVHMQICVELSIHYLLEYFRNHCQN